MTEQSTMLADLLKAQEQFDAVIKDSVNPFHKSKYADLESCINAVKGPLNRNNFILTQYTTEKENGVSVETKALHTSGGEFTGGTLFLPASKEDPQGFGSALTYARRYSLMTAFGMAPEDDDGNGAVNSLKFDSVWFTEKLIPLVINLVIEGKMIKPDGVEEVYGIEKASKLINGYATKAVTKEKILQIYSQYGISL